MDSLEWESEAKRRTDECLVFLRSFLFLVLCQFLSSETSCLLIGLRFLLKNREIILCQYLPFNSSRFPKEKVHSSNFQHNFTFLLILFAGTGGAVAGTGGAVCKGATPSVEQ
jgi:hypothetical protein